MGIAPIAENESPADANSATKNTFMERMLFPPSKDRDYP
jgi:hypothetical protein